MNYNQALEFINNVSKETGMVFGLETSKELLRRVGNPERKLNVIHIAGTNGKGSVGTYLASILDAAGYKTGRFYSPALFAYREVFSVLHNGCCNNISKTQVAKYLTLLASIREDMIEDGFSPATSFELETTMACMFMADEGCDICIVECGLGGELDATNIFEHKLVDVITSIGLDHMNILGSTIEEITNQKCGIIKRNDRVVTAQNNEKLIELICNYCNKIGARVSVCDKSNYQIKENTIHGIMYDDIKHSIEGLRLSMLGTYQLENANLAVEAIFQLIDRGYEIDSKDIKDGLSRAYFKGRFDVVLRNPLLIADGAHNEPAARRLKESIDTYFSDYNKIYVMGVFKDKEYKKILEIMADDQGTFIAGMPDNKRRLESKHLEEIAQNYFCNTYCCDSINQSVQKAIALCEQKKDNDNKTVVICFGSLSIMKEIYDYAMENREIKLNKVDCILSNPEFKHNIDIIEEYEKKRIFCCHGMNHLLDVARITWIMCLENNLKIEKEIVYGAALLHDIGRARQYIDGTNHEDCGADIARVILKESGYSDSEIEIITNVIRFHNDIELDSSQMELMSIMSKADKLSRNCFACEVNEQCKWPADMKNKTIIY